MSIISNPNAFLALLDALGNGEARYPYRSAPMGAERIAVKLELVGGSAPHSARLRTTFVDNQTINPQDVLRTATGSINHPSLSRMYGPVHDFDSGRAFLGKKGYRRVVRVFGTPEIGDAAESLCLALGALPHSLIGVRVAAPNKRYDRDTFLWYGATLVRADELFTAANQRGMTEYLFDLLEEAWNADYDRDGDETMDAAAYPLWEFTVYDGEVIY